MPRRQDMGVGGTDIGRLLEEGFQKTADEQQNMVSLLAQIHKAVKYLGDLQEQTQAAAAVSGALQNRPGAWNQLTGMGGMLGQMAQTVRGAFNARAGQTTVGSMQQQAQPATSAAQMAPVAAVGFAAGQTQAVPAGGTQQAPPPQQQPPAPVPGGGTGQPPPIGGGGGRGGGGAGVPPPPSGPQPPGGGAAQSVAQQALQGGGGESLLSKTWGGIKATAPTTFGAMEAILGEWRSQQDKNNFYRSTSGLDHMEAIGERVREDWNRVKWLGSFSEEEARAATKGVVALGYGQNAPQGPEGGNRVNAEDFIYENKQRFGATVNESLQLLSTASQNANIDLVQLTDALDGLTKSAGEAGVNAQMARAQMDSMMRATTGFGSGSTAYSAAATGGMVGLGRAYSNLDPSYSVQNQGYRYMVAAQAGMSLQEYNAQAMTNPAAAMNAMTGNLIETLKGFLGPQRWAWLETQINQRRQALKENPDAESLRIAQVFWTDNAVAGDLDRNAFLQMMAQFSGAQGFTDEIEAMGYLITQMAGQTAGAQAATQQAKTGQANLTGQSKGQKGMKARVGEQGLMEGEGGGAAGGLKALLDQGVDKGGLFGIGADPQSEVTKAYVKSARKTETRSPVLEAMLQQMSPQEEKDQMVMVNTPTGQRVVHMSVAMRHYKNQLMSGDATFVGGEQSGKNISAYAGTTDETRTKAGYRESKSKGKWSKKGMTEEEWYKEHPEDKRDKDTAWKAGTLKIDLTPAAAELIKIKGYKAAESEGRPKHNPLGTSATRGTGYGTTT